LKSPSFFNRKGVKTVGFLNVALNRFEEIIVSSTLAIAAFLTFIEVILRYVFGASLGFTHEAVVFLLIITGLIGASIGVRKRVHIGVDILVKQFPFKLQKSVAISTYLLSTLFCVIVMILGYEHVQILAKFGQVTPEMEIPLYIPKSIVPIAFGLMSLRFIQETVVLFKTPSEEIFKEEEGVH
jgi:C4-dicarboxylate transporter DctQ subunit